MRSLIFCGVIFFAYLVYVNSDGCIQCNSAIDEKCAVSPDSILAKNCRNASSACYTTFDGVHVMRGCAVQDNITLSKCSNKTVCELCSSAEGCNNKIFPSDRLSCLQCTGNNASSTCAVNILAKSTYCPNYRLGDKCYIWKDNRNKTDSIQRGCLSSIQGTNFCKNLKNCYTCAEYGCNFLHINSTEIPLVRNAAITLGTSLLLVLVGVVLSN